MFEVDVIITNYQGLTPEIQTSIDNAIKGFVDSVRPFVSSADVLANQNDIISENKLISVIYAAEPSSVFDSLSLEIDSVPTPSFTLIDGNIGHLNSVAYV